LEEKSEESGKTEAREKQQQSERRRSVCLLLVAHGRVLDDDEEEIFVRCHHDLVLLRTNAKESQIVLSSTSTHNETAKRGRAHKNKKRKGGERQPEA